MSECRTFEACLSGTVCLRAGQMQRLEASEEKVSRQRRHVEMRRAELAAAALGVGRLL